MSKIKIKVKLKPTEEILMKLLYKEFIRDFDDHKLCAGDSVWIYRQDNKLMNELFNKWLKREGYAQ